MDRCTRPAFVFAFFRARSKADVLTRVPSSRRKRYPSVNPRDRLYSIISSKTLNADSVIGRDLYDSSVLRRSTTLTPFTCKLSPVPVHARISIRETWSSILCRSKSSSFNATSFIPFFQLVTQLLIYLYSFFSKFRQPAPERTFPVPQAGSLLPFLCSKRVRISGYLRPKSARFFVRR